MAEVSQNWNIEIIPGSRRVKRAAEAIKGLVKFLPDSSGYPSEYPKHPERRGAAAMLDDALDPPMPGEIGGVIALPTQLALEGLDRPGGDAA